MNSNRYTRGPGDGYAYDHRGAVARHRVGVRRPTVVRPNDRIRTAGPRNGWPLELGETTHVMLFDADKNHHLHPTTSYTVQVGWYERHWKTCWAAFIPYPGDDLVWTTAERETAPSARTLDVRLSSAYAMAGLLQHVLCNIGLDTIAGAGGTFPLCENGLDALANAFLPSTQFRLPYTDVGVPASQWMTTYYWRFHTDNGWVQSDGPAGRPSSARLTRVSPFWRPKEDLREEGSAVSQEDRAGGRGAPGLRHLGRHPPHRLAVDSVGDELAAHPLERAGLGHVEEHDHRGASRGASRRAAGAPGRSGR